VPIEATSSEAAKRRPKANEVYCLAAVVGVTDQAGCWLPLADGHVEGVQHQLGAQMLSHRPADDPP
jgi:hypothetical protein